VTSISAFRDRLARTLPPGSLRRRLATGVFWSLAGAVVVQLSNAVTSILVARILGKNVFGDFGMVRNTMVMLGVFAGLGLGMTANKFVAEFRQRDPIRAGRILALCFTTGAAISLLMTVAVFLSADWLATRFLRAPELALLIRISAPLLLLNAMNSVQSAGVSGLEAFRQLSICNAVNAVILGVSTIAGALLGGIEGAVWGSLIAVFLACLVLEGVAQWLRRKFGIPLVFRGMWQEHASIVHFALPSLLSNILYQPATWLVTAMLYAHADGRGQVAIFSAASQWRGMVLFVPAALGQVVLPMLTNLWSSGSNRGYIRTLQANSLASFVIGIAAAVPIAIASPWILATYGSGFVEGWLAMCLLAASAVLQATCNVIGQSLASLGRMWWGFALNLLWATELYIAARLLLGYGATGLAAAYLIAYTLHTLQVAAFTIYDLKHKIMSGLPIDPDKASAAASSESLTNESLA
jgi:O-antigen/teichoic acid export membrane protein